QGGRRRVPRGVGGEPGSRGRAHPRDAAGVRRQRELRIPEGPMSIQANRRSFLRAVGAGLAALPMYRLLENSFVQAAGGELPLKFIGVYHPHGVSAEYWAMRDGDTETSFDITYDNCSLQPFDDPSTFGKSFKDRILVIEGIELLSNANGHDTCGTILTGSRITGDLKAQNISLDQFLAVQHGLGSDTRI